MLAVGLTHDYKHHAINDLSAALSMLKGISSSGGKECCRHGGLFACVKHFDRENPKKTALHPTFDIYSTDAPDVFRVWLDASAGKSLSPVPAAAGIAFSLDRKGETPVKHIKDFKGILPADGYAKRLVRCCVSTSRTARE